MTPVLIWAKYKMKLCDCAPKLKNVNLGSVEKYKTVADIHFTVKFFTVSVWIFNNTRKCLPVSVCKFLLPLSEAAAG